MAKRSGQKLKLLYTLDILKKYSDEEHPLNANEIAEKLSLYGIEAERKSIYDDIATLGDYGFDIAKAPSNKGGWFLGERDFEVPEIYLLCDAVKTAKFISAKKTRELISKLNGMLSINDAKKRENSVFFDAQIKCTNEELYYTIDRLSSAIENKKQVKLLYTSRELSDNRQIIKNAKERIINPYALTWQDDHYYLVCNYPRYDNLLHLRVDRINSVEILPHSVRPFSEVSHYRDFFDIADYTKRLFGMYTGELQEVEFCCNKRIIEPVLDRFDENIFIKNVTEDSFSFTAKITLSDALVTWIINYGDDIKIKKPEILKDMIKERVTKVLKNYSED